MDAEPSQAAPAAPAGATQDSADVTSSASSTSAESAHWLQDFASDPSLEKFKDKTPADLAKSYKELQSFVGKPKYDVPAKDAAPEIMVEFYKKLGVPENVDGYTFDLPDTIKNDPAAQAAVKEFASVSHDLKLTAEQAKGIQGWYDSLATKALADQDAQATQHLTGLFEKTFGDNVSVVRERVAAEIAEVLPDLGDRVAIGKLMTNEQLLAMALITENVRKKYGLADSNQGDTAGRTGMSANSLQEEAKKIMTSEEYRNPMSRGHEEAKRKASDLYKEIARLTTTGGSR